MLSYNWREFLRQWSKEVISSSELSFALPDDVSSSGWLGYPGATEDQIVQVETRLKTTLPPSYREFLKTTNGWRMVGTSIADFWSVEEIEWVAVKRLDWIVQRVQGQSMMQRYMDHSRKRPPSAFSNEQKSETEVGPYWISIDSLRGSLEVSDFNSSAICLNPQAVTAESEWETWLFTTWEEGDTKYHSFWEMMQAQYQTILQLRREENRRISSGDSPQVFSAKLQDLIEEFQNKIAHLRSLKSKQPGAQHHHLGLIDGFRVAEERIQAIQIQARDPQELYNQLARLAGELESRAQSEMQGVRSGLGAVRTLLRGPAGVDTFVRANAKLEAYREAADIIRWFLNERR